MILIQGSAAIATYQSTGHDGTTERCQYTRDPEAEDNHR